MTAHDPVIDAPNSAIAGLERAIDSTLQRIERVRIEPDEIDVVQASAHVRRLSRPRFRTIEAWVVGGWAIDGELNLYRITDEWRRVDYEDVPRSELHLLLTSLEQFAT